VLIVRYAPRDWLQLIARQPPAEGRAVLFMDDDMPAALTSGELPLGYAVRTAWRFHSTRAVLQRRGAQLWVSTAALAARHPAACILPPRYLESGSEVPGNPLTYFYHATAAHRREIEWLLPVVRAVQERVPQARFDLVADARAARPYAGVPGVTVRAPLPWAAYRELPRETRFGLGLAPCLEGPFNRGRAHVKFFEITRFGAAGIYSDRPPYSDVVAHGVNGWLCPDREEAWVEAIVAALCAPGLMASVHARALATCRMQASQGAPGP
jgi:hypothetical protein